MNLAAAATESSVRKHAAAVGLAQQISYAGRMRDVSDEQLMQQYAAGSSAAFDILYERHRGPLYRYLLRQVYRESTASDLYQGIWEKVIGARRQYRPKARFATWLYRIAHNHLIDYYRRKKPVADLAVEALADSSDDMAAIVDKDGQRRQLLAAIAQLSEDQRDALLLKLELGLSLEAIGQITGVGRETVKSRLRYATQRLKQLCSDD